MHSQSAILQGDSGMGNLAGNYVLVSFARMMSIKLTKRVASSLVEHSHCHSRSSEQISHMAKVVRMAITLVLPVY